MWRLREQFGVVIDWHARTMRVRRPKTTHVLSFDAFKSVELRGVIRKISTGRSSGSSMSGYRTVYSLALVVQLGSPLGAITLVETDSMETASDEEAYLEMTLIARSIAEALGVPYRFSDFRMRDSDAKTM